MNSQLSVLICPNCKSSLMHDPVEPALLCTACKGKFLISEGVAVFPSDNSYYWGELEKNAIAGLLRQEGAIEESIRSLFRKIDKNISGYLKHYALDFRRAAWRYFAASPEDGAFLDIGCGWGTVSLALASQYQTGWVLDVCPEKTGLVVRRAREQGYNNVFGTSILAWPVLPFKDETFDLVVLNGVLEWLPESASGDPANIQGDVLLEVARILKPNGRLYLGIENRYGYQYFTGKREEHTKLKYISLLPRFAGKMYHAMVRKRPYRTYTYGYQALTGALKRAGLNFQKWTYPYPDYREFDRIVDMDSSVSLHESFRSERAVARIMKRAAASLGLWKYLASSFGVFASKCPPRKSLVEEMVSSYVNEGCLQAPVIQRCDLRATGLMLIELAEGERISLLTVPLDGRASVRLSRERDCIHAARGEISGTILNSLPDPHWHEDGGILVKLEEKIDSAALTIQQRDQYVFKWLAAWQAMTIHRARPALDDIILSVRGRSDLPGKDEYCDCLDKIKLLETAVGRVHGDFHEKNILCGPAAIRRVIDWDLSRPEAPLLWDWIGYYVKRYFKESGCWQDAFKRTISLFSDEFICSKELSGLGFNKQDVRVALATYPALVIWQKLFYGDENLSIIEGSIPLAISISGMDKYGPQ